MWPPIAKAPIAKAITKAHDDTFVKKSFPLTIDNKKCNHVELFDLKIKNTRMKAKWVTWQYVEQYFISYSLKSPFFWTKELL